MIYSTDKRYKVEISLETESLGNLKKEEEEKKQKKKKKKNIFREITSDLKNHQKHHF